ncbi:MAG: IS110 family transposase [Nitrospira sp.]|nr:IS110 family transposase [Nitrospira sp.]MBX3338093.1 IS110 family transposase [Nitrospira sp.]MCW5780447.1 IS110 family transposase [Nitrospira sp.]
MEITTIGIDLAKQVFQLHGVDAHGKTVLRKRLTRSALGPFMANLPPCRVRVEACAGAHYWSRQWRAFGHDVRLMSPHFVKPYVKSQKNDSNDAEAICEAVSRPTMRFVHPKTIGQQDLQALHRIRQRRIHNRTALINQIRGLLMEYGITLPAQAAQVRRRVPGLLDDATQDLTSLGRELLEDLYRELVALDEHLLEVEGRIKRIFAATEVCGRLAQVEGVGPLIATAMIAAVGDPHAFKNGRQLAAWLGLVPRQRSSGGKHVLLGITKRGDRYLRALLIHGARAVVVRATAKTDTRSCWIAGLQQRRGTNRASVAVANKNVRILWALMTTQAPYRRAA